MTQGTMEKKQKRTHNKEEMNPLEGFLWRCAVVLMAFILLCSLYLVWEFVYIFYTVFSALLAA